MDAGERLVGRHGVDGVTLRDIALLAEQANSNVIQYHFKDKSGLIGAILEDRIQRRENLRCKRLEALKAAGKGNDPRALLAILWLPTLAFRDENGEYLFCRFVLQCMLQADFAAQYPLYERYDAFSRRTKAKEGDHKGLSELMALLRTHYKKLPPEVFSRRLMALSLMFISCAVEFDNARAQGPKDAELDAEPILDMAIAAMAAPT
jgi:AcrR family transcriptional regulator